MFNQFNTLRSKMTLICILGISVPFIICMAVYTVFMNKTLKDKVGYELLSNLVTQSALIDDSFSRVQEGTAKMMMDETLYRIFSKEEFEFTDMEYYMEDKLVSQALNRYYSNQPDIYASYIITPDYLFGHMQVYHPLDVLDNSELYKIAAENDGKEMWIPTFRYQDMFPEAKCYSDSLNYMPFFAYTRKIQFISQSDYSLVPKSGQLPIVLLYFQSNYFDSFFKASEDFSSNIWILADEDVVYSNTGDHDFPYMNEALALTRGEQGSVMSSDKKNLLTYVSSEITGWKIISMKSVEDMMSDTYRLTGMMAVAFVFLLIAVTILTSVFIVQMLKPMDHVRKAILKSGEGHFKLAIPVSGTKELQTLAKAYNKMNRQIDSLMEDVYRARLSETKTKLLSMQMQMEPHFLYNTLNAINWMAVDNNQEEISEMLQLLANMLRYTLSQENELVSLDKDMHWIKAYSKIIRLRFGDNIDFDFSGIDDRLYDTDVPVLLFQPFIENSVLHGINGYVEKGEIKIRGYIDKDVRIFEVEDNGKGITEEEKEALWEKNPLHLGIRNVDIRIKLIYGDNWGVSISSENQKTIVKICMPL